MGIALHYAYKCFSDHRIVSALDQVIDGFTVASSAECDQLLGQGVSAQRMIFTNPVKAPDQIEHAFQRGVQTYAFQSSDEITKIARYAPGARVQCRVQVDDSENHDGQRFSHKFGANPHLVVDLLQAASEAGLRPEGLTFHVGSQSTKPSLWTDAIALCGELIEAADRRGIELTALNLGGGFPVDYLDGSDRLLAPVTAAIRDACAQLPEGLALMAEPGRVLVADSAVIVTTVIGREDRHGVPWLYLDTGVFQSLLETLEFGRLLQRVLPLSPGRDLESSSDRFVLAGPTCDGADVLSEHVELPAETTTGDRLLITGAGAYTLAYGSDFNGHQRPTIVNVATERW